MKQKKKKKIFFKNKIDTNFRNKNNKKIKRQDEISLKKEETKIYRNNTKATYNYKDKYFNLISKILKVYLFFIIFPYSLSKKNDLRKINLVSEIKITINGTGDQQILADTNKLNGKDCIYPNIPDEIYINDIKLNYTGKKIFNLEGEINNIKQQLIPLPHNIFLNI